MLEWDSEFFGKTERSVVARVRNRHNDIGFNGKLARELATHFGPDFADRDAANFTVRSRKINILEHAEGRPLRLKWKFRTNSVFVDDQNFAGLNVSNELGMNQVERAGFRRE